MSLRVCKDNERWWWWGGWGAEDCRRRFRGRDVYGQTEGRKSSVTFEKVLFGLRLERSPVLCRRVPIVDRVHGQTYGSSGGSAGSLGRSVHPKPGPAGPGTPRGWSGCCGVGARGPRSQGRPCAGAVPRLMLPPARAGGHLPEPREPLGRSGPSCGEPD